jgi:hypothetical protein
MSSPQPFSSCDVVGGPSGNLKKQRYSAWLAGSLASVPAPGKIVRISSSKLFA